MLMFRHDGFQIMFNGRIRHENDNDDESGDGDDRNVDKKSRGAKGEERGCVTIKNRLGKNPNKNQNAKNEDSHWGE